MKSKSENTFFDQLFFDYKSRFVHFAETYVRDRMVAEDIVIDSMMYYWENRAKLAPDSNVPAYIVTVIKHKCLNYLHHLRIQEDVAKCLKDIDLWELNFRISTLEACNPETIFSNEIQTIVEKTLKTLPAQTHEIFVRSRYDRLSHKEIAQSLGISVKSVEFHITKALKAMRIALKDYLPSGKKNAENE